MYTPCCSHHSLRLTQARSRVVISTLDRHDMTCIFTSNSLVYMAVFWSWGTSGLHQLLGSSSAGGQKGGGYNCQCVGNSPQPQTLNSLTQLLAL